ncbi:MAG: amidohydrolase family protein [Spirochaetales bacterium]|nr:amidohydrolase family protein [Spirochaetales bacterium]
MIVYSADWLIQSADLVNKDYGILVDGGKVTAVRSRMELEEMCSRGEAEEGGHFHVLAPGFINAHMHQYGLLSHGIPIHVEIKDFEDFLWKFWWPFMEDRIRCKDVLVTSRASAAELIESGVTGFCDTLEAPRCEPGTLIKQAKVIEQIGMRAVLSLESCERIDEENGQYCLEENEKLIRWAKEHSSLVSGAFCTHTSFTCSPDFMKKAACLAEELDSLWQFHLSESRYESDYTQKHFGKRPVHHYENEGLLSSRVVASQCVKVDETEIPLLKKYSVRPVHMPVSNCEVGGGFSPVPEMLEAGLPVSIGTDGYENDFLTTIRMAFLIHKAVKEDPSVLPAKEIFRMATEYGARALGWEDCGTLESGKNADFFCMDTSFPTPLREENLFDQIIVFGKKEYISHVYCGGKALMENRELTTLDRDAVKKEMAACAEEFWRPLL